VFSVPLPCIGADQAGTAATTLTKGRDMLGRIRGIAAVGLGLLCVVNISAQDTAIRSFEVKIPQPELDDLKRRIQATRWPEKETVTDHSQGVPLATMQKVAKYWAND
jgi:hypothetical protein